MTEIDKIKKTLDKHEKRISYLEKLFKTKSVSLSLDGEKTILNLINSGFFNTPKKYGETIKTLKTKAKFNKNHNYRGILNKLTSEERLERKMVDHQWTYVKVVK